MNASQLKKILPQCKNPEEWAELLTQKFDEHGLTQPWQQAMFIAQAGHESGSFNITEENLNYSASALVKLFPKYFPGDLKKHPQIQFTANVEDYHRKPEMIANRIYANRMGNGDEASGDGWKYRGGGLIQLTGRDNYRKFGESYNGDGIFLDNDPSPVRTDKEMAVESAFWFWFTNGLDKIQDVVVATKKINGGTFGLEERTHHYQIGLQVLS
jgi:putative chitinase